MVFCLIYDQTAKHYMIITRPTNALKTAFKEAYSNFDVKGHHCLEVIKGSCTLFENEQGQSYIIPGTGYLTQFSFQRQSQTFKVKDTNIQMIPH